MAEYLRLKPDTLSSHRGVVPDKTVGQLIDRYMEEEVPNKKGAKWEMVRCKLLKRARIAQVRCKNLDHTHLATWQKERLRDVSSASVRRERNILNHILNLAVREWGWLRYNPFERVRRPADSKPRDRVPTKDELDALIAAASPEMRRVITIATQTGMRASEIASLKHWEGRVAHVKDAKTLAGVRLVPLTQVAVGVLKDGPITITAGSISALFIKLCDKAEIEGLHFHDLRRYAGSWLSKHMDPMQLAKVLGHSDPRITMKHYYQNDVAALAEKLG